MPVNHVKLVVQDHNTDGGYNGHCKRKIPTKCQKDGPQSFKEILVILEKNESLDITKMNKKKKIIKNIFNAIKKLSPIRKRSSTILNEFY